MRAGSWLSSDEEVERHLNESGVLVRADEGQVRELRSKIGARRVAAELAKLTGQNSVERGFRVAALSEQSWRVDFFNFASALAGDLEEKSLHLVTAVLVFEGGFPTSEGPSLRLVSPRMDWRRSSKALTAGGVFVFETGWWKAQATEQVLGGLARQVLQECRLDAEATQPCYTHEDWAASLSRASVSSSSSAHSGGRAARFEGEYVLRVSRTLRQGNKIVLPTSALRALTRDGEEPLPSPLVLELQAAGRSGLTTHVGVWEFSAAEGEAEAPQWVLDNVGAEDGAACRVRLVALPHCSRLRLQPFSRRFMKVNGNDRNKVLASLAASIQRFAAFTVGDVAELIHDGEPFLFFILGAQPAQAVTCVAEDNWVEMELDFVQPVDFAESAEGLSVSSDGDSQAGVRLGGADNNNNSGPAEGTTQCPHCRHFVPAAAATMHEVACARRNAVCDRCGSVVAKATIVEHLATQHVLLPCPRGCGEQIEAFRMANHSANECLERKVSCEYCGFFCSSKNLPEHAELCGNKSFRCGDCGRLLRVNQRASHECAPGGSEWFCPLCVGGAALRGEKEFVAHLEQSHSKAAKDVCLACPICISEGSIGLNDAPPPLLAHLELHKYRLQMKSRR